MRRVVITGLGVIAPNGIGKQAFWDACVNGVSGAGRVTQFDVSPMTSQIACEVRDFDPGEFGLTEYESTCLDRHVQLALASAIGRWRTPTSTSSRSTGERAGVYIGSTNSAPTTFESVWEELTDKGAESLVGKPLPPEFYFGILSNAAGSSIAIRYGFKGPTALISDACSSGVDAIEQAYLAIVEGFCDVALAGGTDASVTPMGLTCYCVARRRQPPQRRPAGREPPVRPRPRRLRARRGLRDVRGRGARARPCRAARASTRRSSAWRRTSTRTT